MGRKPVRICPQGHDKDVVGRTASYGCRACQRESIKRWKEKNRDRVAKGQSAAYARNRERIIEERYGMAPGEYAQRLHAQDQRCALCRRPFAEMNRQQICTDHCHATGRVRGIVCVRCNLFIGMVESKPDIVQRVSAYLSAP